jgi:hypothetical protein
MTEGGPSYHDLVDENAQLRAANEQHRLATAKAVRAWDLARAVIHEQFPGKAGDLIEQGIQDRVEKEVHSAT